LCRVRITRGPDPERFGAQLPDFSTIMFARERMFPPKVQDQVRVVMRTRHKLTYNKPDDFSIATG